MENNSETPVGPVTKKECGDIIDAVWVQGWKSGNEKGWKDGFKTGRSVMNQWRTVVAVVIFLTLGMLIGYSADWVQTCEPILVSDVKSCITRYGTGQ